jgi:hypothetical protein
MAGTPDFAQIVTVLDSARKVCACSRHRPILSAAGADQQTRAIAETENLSTVRPQVADAPGHYSIASKSGAFGGTK